MACSGRYSYLLSSGIAKIVFRNDKSRDGDVIADSGSTVVSSDGTFRLGVDFTDDLLDTDGDVSSFMEIELRVGDSVYSSETLALNIVQDLIP